MSKKSSRCVPDKREIAKQQMILAIAGMKIEHAAQVLGVVTDMCRSACRDTYGDDGIKTFDEILALSAECARKVAAEEAVADQAVH